jgi:hypothetical protein
MDLFGCFEEIKSGMCCDSPNLWQFSGDAVVLFSHFGRMTDWFIGPADLLASYDLFFLHSV